VDTDIQTVLTGGQWKNGHRYMKSGAGGQWKSGHIYEQCLQEGSGRVDTDI